jgi:CRP-like cAMP-binding protein
MPYGTPPVTRRVEGGKFNRFLATLPPHDFALLAPQLRTIALERGAMLHDVGEEIEHVYFPHSGMVSLVAVMQSGATVETASIGRAGVIGVSAGLGARWALARSIVQLPGTAGCISASQFHAAANQSQAIRDFIVPYNDVLLAQVQQSVACNALHTVEARLCRWLLQARDCVKQSARIVAHRSGTSTTPSPLQSPRVSLPLSRDSKPRNRIEWAMGLTHRGLHRDGIGPKRTDDTFGQACRIAFASLRQTDDFFSDRCRHGSPTVSDI